MDELGDIGPDLRDAFDRVEKLRLERGFSQAELARAAKLSEATYNRLVRERTRRPYRRTVVALRTAIVELTGSPA